MGLIPCLAQLSLRSTPVGMRGVNTSDPEAVAYFSRQPSRGRARPSPSRSRSGDDVEVVRERTWAERDAELRRHAIPVDDESEGESEGESAQRKRHRTDDLEGMQAKYAEQKRLAAVHLGTAKGLIESDDADQAMMALEHAKLFAAQMKRIRDRMNEERDHPPAAAMAPARTGTRRKQVAKKAVAAAAAAAAAARPPPSSSVPTDIRSLAPPRDP